MPRESVKACLSVHYPLLCSSGPARSLSVSLQHPVPPDLLMALVTCREGRGVSAQGRGPPASFLTQRGPGPAHLDRAVWGSHGAGVEQRPGTCAAVLVVVGWALEIAAPRPITW